MMDTNVKIGVVAIIIICSIVFLSVIYGQVAPETDSETIPSSGGIKTVGISAYTDSSLSTKITDISWGILVPSQTTTHSLYIYNDGNRPVTLSMLTTNWNPQEAQTYLNLDWDYADQTLNAGQGLELTFTLTVASDITNINTFSFDITIVGTEAL